MGVVGQSHSDLADIKRCSFLYFELDAGVRFSSAALARLEFCVEYPLAHIDHGEVELKEKLKWRSVLMRLHSTFVFLGMHSFGRSSLNFRYGLPWSSKAGVVLALLVALRGQVAVTRKQALAAYAMELQAVNLPGVALWVFVAGLSVPRRGWSKR